MNKISIIIRREYLARVRKKSFIIMTILTPLLIAAMTILPYYLSNIKDGKVKNVVVIDQTGKYSSAFQSNETYHFELANTQLNAIKQKTENYAIIVISSNLTNNPNGVSIYSENQISFEFKTYISNILSAFVENEKLQQYNIPELKNILEKSKTTININTIKLSKDGSETNFSSEMALAIGMGATFLIYFFIIIYGAQVMRGVVEEKTSRVVEVIISSVRPFQLMMGKIIGIALVGLTQFLIWIILIGIIFSMTGGSEMMLSGNSLDLNNNHFIGINSILSGINLTEIFSLFIVYFLGGYLLYASLFAAIGAASDNETDTQQFVLPITIPIFFALYAAIYSANNPDAPLAFWCSLIPFTSPIVMMVRIPLGVPIWQIALSLFILLISFLSTTWVAAKIYRTGILMYGKKVNYKEIWKWLKYK